MSMAISHISHISHRMRTGKVKIYRMKLVQLYLELRQLLRLHPSYAKRYLPLEAFPSSVFTFT